MVGNRQHEANNQRFVFFVIFEISKHLIQLLPFVLRKQQVLILKLPSARKQFKLVMIPEHLKVLEVLKA